ncbi:carnosine N-methyltransferase 2 isoform X2 [Columba livia]|uniref:carnosine N-methyltransferase 2 isoform X2 n=1 Tax=Columba livia TaxID=8932 RepID=UPI0031B9BA17
MLEVSLQLTLLRGGAAELQSRTPGHRQRRGGHANIGARSPVNPESLAQPPCPDTAPTLTMDPAPEMKRNRFPSMNFEAEILTAPHDNSELYVIPSMRSLTAEEYVEAFKSFLDHSTEHQCMDQFNKEEMPKIMASLGNGKSTINVLGVGSGTGEQDLKMIRILQAAHPGVLIDNEIIEPNPQHVAAYKELVNQAPDLQNVSFIWHQLTSSEYEQQVKEKGTHKKFDFIHMIQMLYRVEDIHNTIKFFHSCLNHHGKLLIIILSDSSGWASLWKKYRHCLPPTDSGHYVTSNGITDVLKRLGVVYRVHEFPSGWDITECFIEGDPVGGLMMDFLTGTKDFLGTAPPALRRRLHEALCQPECSSRKDGRIIFSNNLNDSSETTVMEKRGKQWENDSVTSSLWQDAGTLVYKNENQNIPRARLALEAPKNLYRNLEQHGFHQIFLNTSSTSASTPPWSS